MRSRSRSPLLTAPTVESREALLAEFGRLYHLPPDSPDVPPWAGRRAARVIRFREQLVGQVEAAVQELDIDVEDIGLTPPSTRVIARWQRFTLNEDLARMSDVLFRGPISVRHGDEVDLRLHTAWRKFQSSIADLSEFVTQVTDFRISAVQIAMVLETVRPIPEEIQLDCDNFELPDARTLACLLAMRCEKDDIEELLEMYRLICQKLQGVTCTWCNQPFDEGSSVGIFNGEDFKFPGTVPKILVPQCGHAMHTLCFGSQLAHEAGDGGCRLRGDCRRCGLPYAWTSIDVDPMVSAFCLLFGSYVNKRACEMRFAGELSQTAVVSIAEVCQSFSMELNGLVSPTAAWAFLIRRRNYTEPETVDMISDMVLRLLTPSEPLEPEEEEEERRRSMKATALFSKTDASVICPDDRSEGSVSAAGDADEPITEVFIPEPDSLLNEGAAVDVPVPEDGFHV
mmetsp:Transcript_126287/g.252309  ORF Transcript_126287/g.252309 Transcript_126287/m.252309 type:complete len:455 (+) Transcript_126287:66-1430(+)